MKQPCDHHVTLETDVAHGVEVIKCLRCGARAEIPFIELARDPGDGSDTIARYVRAMIGVPSAPTEEV